MVRADAFQLLASGVFFVVPPLPIWLESKERSVLGQEVLDSPVCILSISLSFFFDFVPLIGARRPLLIFPMHCVAGREACDPLKRDAPF